MKNFSIFFAAAALLTAGLFADQEADATIAATTDSTMRAGACDTLPQDQQAFAAQLSAANKTMFCSQFSPAQRSSAMQMAGTPNASGMKMTPDQAVEQVGRGAAPAQRSGGCPVR